MIAVTRIASQFVPKRGGCAISVVKRIAGPAKMVEFAARNGCFLGRPINGGADHENRTSVMTRTIGRVGYEVRTCAQLLAIYTML